MNVKIVLKKAVSVLTYVFVLLFIVFYFLTATIGDTSKSYSLTQNWKEYYSVFDWDLKRHAIADIDGDGQKDMVTFTNCVFLSAPTIVTIAKKDQCTEPNMATIVFRDKNIVGQRLIPQKPFSYDWLHKSYLVKTNNYKWQFYDMIGLQLRKYEMGADKRFREVTPTILDMVDMFTYQVRHVGVVIVLLAMHS